jgi:hypothetical protein
MNSRKQKQRNRQGPRRAKLFGTKGEDVVRTYNLSFIPVSANVTLAGSAAYNSGNGRLTGPGASAVDASAGITISLNDLSNQSEFTALYDAFRIDEVELSFHPVGNVQPIADDAAGSSLTTAFPEALETAIDLDDTTAPTTIGEMLQYETYKYNLATSVAKVAWVPRVAREIFDGVTPSFEEPEGPVWVDCAQGTTPHYGCKVWMGTSGSSSNLQNAWIIRGKMRISFKRTH